MIKRINEKNCYELDYHLKSTDNIVVNKAKFLEQILQTTNPHFAKAYGPVGKSFAFWQETRAQQWDIKRGRRWWIFKHYYDLLKY